MPEDGLTESLIDKLKSYSEAPRGNVESFRSVVAKLHCRAASQDKSAKERTLERISNPKTGILQVLLGLIQKVDDDTALCSVAGILHECASPKAGKSRRSAINQLVSMNASQILVCVIMQQQTVTETLLFEMLWLLGQVAQRDPKFSVKARLLGATKAFHILLRNYYTSVRLLCPLLLVFKSLTRSRSTTTVLVKDGFLSTLEKVLLLIGCTPNLKLKLTLTITNYLTKSRLCCNRIVKGGLLSLLLRIFDSWERYDGKNRLKICNHVLVTLQHLCGTKAGRQNICGLNGISVLHRFGTTCPEDRCYDSLLSRVCHIVNMCVDRKQLPLDSLPSPATFNVPRLKTVDAKESFTSTNDIIQDSYDDDSDEDYGDEDDEGDSDEFGEGDDGDDDEDGLKKRSHHKVLKLEAAVKRSAEDLAGYNQYFQEFFKVEEKKKKKDLNLWSTVVPPYGVTVINESYYRKRSAEDMYSSSVSEHDFTDRYTSDSNTKLKGLSLINDIHEDTSFRHAYAKIASRVNSVLPFVKIAHPDMMVGEGVSYPEPFNVKDRRVCRAKLLACMERSVRKLETPNRVVFDLDTLITEFPQSQQLENKERLLFNLDEAHLRQKQPSKPHLCFESRFESGNLRKAIQVGETEYDLILMPDVNSSTHHQWFYFQVSNMEKGVPYIFNIINCEKQNGQFNYGMKPLMYSVQEAVLGRPNWARVGTDICYYRNCYRNTMNSKPRSYLTTTFTITFLHSYDICYIAYHYPYTYSQLLAQIWKWSLSVNPERVYFRAENLCLSLNNNETPLLTVTAPDSDDNTIQTRGIIFLTSRVHPGESNASWVMHGTINYLLSEAPSAVHLRNKFVFKIVPMLNMEGVLNGCHRCGLTNQDLNRCWSRPNQYLHPVIYHTKGLLEYCVRILKKTPAVFCDYHGHSRRKNVFFYGCSKADSWYEADRETPENPADYLLLPHLMNNLSPAFSLQQCSFQVEYGRESTARVTVWREFGVKCSYTMESSYCGFDQGTYEGHHLNTNHLREIGQHFCEALANLHDSSYWKTGCPLNLSAALETSESEDRSECSDCEEDDTTLN